MINLKRLFFLLLSTMGALSAVVLLLSLVDAPQQAQASPLAAPTSSIKLVWSSGVLSLTEQNAGADGQVSVEVTKVSSVNVLNLTLPAGTTFAAGSTAAGSNLSYPTSNQARINIDAATIAWLGIDLGQGSDSSLTFGTVNNPSRIYAINLKSGGDLTVTQVAARDQISANVGAIVRGAAGVNLIAPTLQLSGTYGLGAAGNALGTQTSIAEMNTITGSIYITNTGDLRIGISNTNGINRTNLFPGIQVLATTGNYVVELGVTGVLSASLVSDTIKAPGAITVTVNQNIEAACMISGSNDPFVWSRYGPVRVTSTNGDILLGNYRNYIRYGCKSQIAH
jgi:hypothetical protein